MGVFDSITFGWVDEAEVKLACENVNEQEDVSDYVRQTDHLIESLHDIASLLPSAWNTIGGNKAFNRVMSVFGDLNCSKLNQASSVLIGNKLDYNKISAYKSTRI